MRQKVKIAGIQMEPTLMEKEENLSSCLEKIRETAREGAGLIVFPECNLSGYCFSSLKEAIQIYDSNIYEVENYEYSFEHEIIIHQNQ